MLLVIGGRGEGFTEGAAFDVVLEGGHDLGKAFLKEGISMWPNHKGGNIRQWQVLQCS